MQRYIPINSRIVVKNLQGKTVWYDNREEIAVPDGELSYVGCPIRGITTVTFGYKGCEVWCLKEQIRTKLDKDQLSKARNLRLYKLEYDVPVDRPQDVEFVHPALYLHPLAIRTTKSVWVIPQDSIPWHRLNQLTEVGATWDVEKIDVSEIEKTLNKVINAICNETNQLIRSSEDAQTRANERLEATPDEDDPNAAAKKYVRTAMATIKKNQKLLNELESAAKVFGLSHVTDWNNAKAAHKAVETTVHQRAKYYAEAIEELRKINTSDTAAIADAMEVGTIPVDVAADMLRDEGKDEVADKLSDVFSLADVGVE